MFELQHTPAPAGLASLGTVVEFRELSYGAMRDIQSGADPGQSLERLLGATLFVDGAAIGYEGLRSLPGRFSGAIADALGQTLLLYGLERAAKPSAAAGEGADSPEPPDAPEGPKA